MSAFSSSYLEILTEIEVNMTSRNSKNADRWLLLGNLLTVAGSAALGIGAVLKAAAGSGLPTGKPVYVHPNVNENHGTNSANARLRGAEDYFSI